VKPLLNTESSTN